MGRIFDIVEHPNVGHEELAYREPQTGSGDFRIGSQVIVRENQAAVFVRDGRALDVLGPGMHTISTANIPLLVEWIGKVFGGETPFKAEVYFVNVADFPQVGWGTSQPLVLETPGKGLGWLLLQGHGVMDMRVSDVPRFAKQYAIGKATIGLSNVKDRLLTMVLGELQNVIAKYAPGDVMGLNRMIGELESVMLVGLREQFDAVGLALRAFEMSPLSATKTTADDLRSMGYLDLATYQGLQAADALRDAARNPGGGAGTGVGLGAGIGLGQNLAAALQHSSSQQSDGGTKGPSSRAEIEALLDNLDVRLASGELDRATYDRLVGKWQARLDELK